MAAKLDEAVTDYDHLIQHTSWEDDELRTARSMMDVARHLSMYLAEIHHVFYRHVFRSYFEHSRETLLNTLYSMDETIDKLKRILLYIVDHGALTVAEAQSDMVDLGERLQYLAERLNRFLSERDDVINMPKYT